MTHLIRTNYTPIGTIQKVRGLEGQLIVHLTYPSIAIPLQQIFFHLHHTYVPYRVAHWESAENHGILHLQAIHNRTQALPLRGKTLFATTDIVKKALANTPFELTGYTATDINHGLLGTITTIEKQPLQILLCLFYKGKTIRIPLKDVFIQHINHTDHTITTRLPEAYLDSLTLKTYNTR